MRTPMKSKKPLSERIRLIRILRTHGLRAVERLRADELKTALEKLGLTVDHDVQDVAWQASTTSAPTSTEHLSAPSSAQMAAPPSEASAPPSAPLKTPEPSLEEESPEDPMDPRFREPANFLPHGERTFLRLIAVDWQQLFATWDLDDAARARLGGDDARLIIRVADVSSGEHGDILASEHVRVNVRGWYLRAPEQRLRVVAALLTPAGEVLTVSNAVIVPPNHPSPPGPLRFATVPLSVDRRELRGGALLEALIDESAGLPEGVVVDESGRQVRAPRPDEVDPSAPSSGKRRLITSWAPELGEVSSAPSSFASAPSSQQAPSSSGVIR